MKTTRVLSILLLGLFLMACSGSDTYRGRWQAVDTKGQSFDLLFEAKKLTVTDSTKKSKSYDYTQNSVTIQGHIETYGIVLGDGQEFKLKFPFEKNEDTGYLLNAANELVYTIRRNGAAEEINKDQLN